MDAHVFRLLCRELSRLLTGARVEKIHAPAPDLTVFTVFSGRRKRYIALKSGRQNPFIYLDEAPLPNPPAPPAHIMRLRKYFAGRRLGEAKCDWVGRRIFLPAKSGPDVGSTDGGTVWLILDLVQGPSLSFSEPAPLAETPESLFTPLLRKTLEAMEAQGGTDAALEKASLLADLEYEISRNLGSLYVYGPEVKTPLSAWPVPGQGEPGATLTFDAKSEGGALGDIDGAGDYPGLFAARAAFAPLAAALLGRFLTKEEDAGRKGDLKRRARLLKNLEQEEERLSAMLERRKAAILLQENLWRFAPDAKAEVLNLEGTTLRLNPLLTVRENMARMFHDSDRGARGLAMLKERRVTAEEAYEEAKSGLAARPSVLKPGGVKDSSRGIGGRRKPDGPLKSGERRIPDDEKFVRRLKSSDGFIFLLGKSAKGNQAILKMALPHDLWFHAADGPSAHLICRRDHGAVQVPQSTIQEAAALVGLKSPQREAGKAEVMCAEVKDVRPLKGQPPGTVRVGKVRFSIMVDLDPELEERLLGL